MARSDSSSAFSVSEELKLIPRWSIILAFIAFIGIDYLFFFVLHQHYQPHPGAHLFWNVMGRAGRRIHADDRIYQ